MYWSKNARYIQRYRKRYTFFDTSLIHIRYVNDTKTPKLALYQELDTVLTPHQSCDFVSSVYRSVSNTHLLDGYIRGYTFDTATIHNRYVTIQVMGKMHHDTWGNGVGVRLECEIIES